MKITNIEIIPINPGLAARNADQQIRFRQIDQRTVFKVETDNGLVGYGEYRVGPPPASRVEQLIGRSPFDFINGDLNLGLSQWSLGLAGALYDVDGSYDGAIRMVIGALAVAAAALAALRTSPPRPSGGLRPLG